MPAGGIKQRLFDLLEAGERRSRLARAMDAALCTLIVANVASVVAGTVPEIDARFGAELTAFEHFSVAIFVLEYLARLWVCDEHLPLRPLGPVRARLRFAATPSMLIDALAILPALVLPFVTTDLTALRVIRLVRILKLARYSTGLMTLGRVLYTERRPLLATFVVMLGLIVAAATVMYMIEREAQPQAFGTIPAAMWWALATLTTVGYGDVVPVTGLGRVFGGMIAILGIAVYALPVAIVASGFMNELQRRDFAVSWGMVAQVPLFAHLDAQSVGRIVSLLQARQVPRAYTIMRKGDIGDAFYIVVAGQVDVLLDGGEAVQLGSGDFFGEMALLSRAPRTATVIATTDCRLLVLDAYQFHQMLDDYPGIREKIVGVASRRGADGNTVP
jgi:voltage-gated potassium channel